MTPAQSLALQSLRSGDKPLCAACGKHSVERKGQLCNAPDLNDEGEIIDGDTWHCAEKAAWFAIVFHPRARHMGIVWQLSAQAEKVGAHS